jgi:hypothetical protein
VSKLALKAAQKRLLGQIQTELNILMPYFFINLAQAASVPAILPRAEARGNLSSITLNTFSRDGISMAERL